MNSGLDVALSFLQRCRQNKRQSMASTTLVAIVNSWARRRKIYIAISVQDIEAAASQLGFVVTPSADARSPRRIGVMRRDVSELQEKVCMRAGRDDQPGRSYSRVGCFGSRYSATISRLISAKHYCRSMRNTLALCAGCRPCSAPCAPLVDIGGKQRPQARCDVTCAGKAWVCALPS
jgi:hypothetical protein